MGERLRGMADDDWSYATEERGAERARHGLEQAGEELERAVATLVERLNVTELWPRQYQRMKVLEKPSRQKTYDGL